MSEDEPTTGPTFAEIGKLLEAARIPWELITIETRERTTYRAHRDRMHTGDLVWQISPGRLVIVSFQPGKFAPGDEKCLATSGSVGQIGESEAPQFTHGGDVRVVEGRLVLLTSQGNIDLLGSAT